MGKIGKISTISKEFRNSSIQTMESELSKKGMTRIPGTGVFKFPYKELSGVYRTGLDPDAAYIKRIMDTTERDIEVTRVTKLREKLEEALGGLDLGPRSSFWNYALSRSADDLTHVQPYKLQDGDNLFDLSIPFQELMFAWMRVHPTIASSQQAYEQGHFPSETQFYVHDAEIENAIVYKKKQLINKAVVKLDGMSPSRRVKVARLVGLPIPDGTKEEVVYNLLDTMIKQTEFKDGTYKGLDPVKIFTQFADMKDGVLHIKDLVKQAIAHSIYRKQPSGKIYEGEYEVSTSEEELVKHLSDDSNQEELLLLEDKLKGKKLAGI
jgi:hypothetical protein